MGINLELSMILNSSTDSKNSFLYIFNNVMVPPLCVDQSEVYTHTHTHTLESSRILGIFLILQEYVNHNCTHRKTCVYTKELRNSASEAQCHLSIPIEAEIAVLVSPLFIQTVTFIKTT